MSNGLRRTLSSPRGSVSTVLTWADTPRGTAHAAATLARMTTTPVPHLVRRMLPSVEARRCPTPDEAARDVMPAVGNYNRRAGPHLPYGSRQRRQLRPQLPLPVPRVSPQKIERRVHAHPMHVAVPSHQHRVEPAERRYRVT